MRLFILLLTLALTVASLPRDEYPLLRIKRQWGGGWGGGHPPMTLPMHGQGQMGGGWQGGHGQTGGGWAGRYPPGLGSALGPGAAPYGRKM
ncbi:hypothetical protein Aduo_006003 [Ancylostoma duodenale]